ncbi:hypothetical protein C4546_00140 [Candidatus Parcubacteria bacterium]|jgi:hypothetical protein|nr:MAG: hypothetical protein C4546_00140 [Candidatus Parcubacteria bacterium]
MEVPKPNPKSLRLFYFWVGVVATFSYRAIIFFNELNPAWLKISWYIGTVGFIIYFSHRFVISTRRARLIKELHLAEKVAAVDRLSETEKRAMQYVFQTLGSSRERWNYIFIFIMSGLALIFGLITDFLID